MKNFLGRNIPVKPATGRSVAAGAYVWRDTADGSKTTGVMLTSKKRFLQFLTVGEAVELANELADAVEAAEALRSGPETAGGPDCIGGKESS